MHPASNGGAANGGAVGAGGDGSGAGSCGRCTPTSGGVLSSGCGDALGCAEGPEASTQCPSAEASNRSDDESILELARRFKSGEQYQAGLLLGSACVGGSGDGSSLSPYPTAEQLQAAVGPEAAAQEMPVSCRAGAAAAAGHGLPVHHAHPSRGSSSGAGGSAGGG